MVANQKSITLDDLGNQPGLFEDIPTKIIKFPKPLRAAVKQKLSVMPQIEAIYLQLITLSLSNTTTPQEYKRVRDSYNRVVNRALELGITHADIAAAQIEAMRDGKVFHKDLLPSENDESEGE